MRERAPTSAEADDLIGFLGLGRYANSRISDLSTGTRRIVELAGLLALDARVLCLDEPTAGVAQRETEAFGPLIKEIRRELGAAMLVIEHDMPLIMSISDRVYCLEIGRVIAEGVPDDVRNDPKVDRELPRHRRARHRPQRRGRNRYNHYHGRTLEVMRRTPLNDNWLVRPKVNRFAEIFGAPPEWESATLPHDAMIGE